MRARDLGIRIGELPPGPLNGITDVAGVRVGHATIVRGDGPLIVGQGPVRTGVTVIQPRSGLARDEPCFAGCHRLNGNGELTGLEWIREAGMLTTPVAITNTHSVGVVRDALIAAEVGARTDTEDYWALPVVGETYDGVLSDINGFHVTLEHVREALADARGGAVAEGAVGGGTGMICHGFKGGIGTASRIVPQVAGGYCVGVLVQANYGRRDRLRVDGVPVGQAISADAVPEPGVQARMPPGAGSIIVVVATDAPLLPGQCARLAQRAGLGLARAGGTGDDSSGDLFVCFATGNRGLPRLDYAPGKPVAVPVAMVANPYLGVLFEAVIEATEEAILNALVAARTMTGRDGIVAHALEHDRLRAAMRSYGRP
jgi:D-aminopeptidase